MNAMVLAAGLGTRLRPITESVPKPLVRLAGCTLLQDLLHHLASQGVEMAVINGSWRADVLEEWLMKTPLPLKTVFQREDDPLGTAGAVRRALPHLGGEFAVAYGDNLTRQPLSPLLELHRELQAEVTMALAPTGEPSRKGIVLTGPEGLVTEFREKPPDEVAESNLANSGIYICRSSAVEDIPDGGFCDFGRTLFPEMLLQGRRIAADTVPGYTRDIGTPRDFLLACHDILSGRLRPYISDAVIEGSVLIECLTPCRDISIEGTFWAGRGCEIGPGCVFENCVVLSGAEIGPGCSLRNTLVMPGSKVPGETLADDKYLKIF